MLLCLWCVIVIECALSSCALCAIASATPYASRACVRLRAEKMPLLGCNIHSFRDQLNPLDHLTQSGC